MLSLVACCVHDLVVHAIVRAVCALAPESLVRRILEWRQHLLIVCTDVRVVRQLIFDKWLLVGPTSTCVWYVWVLRVSWVVTQILGLHFALDQLRVCWHVAHDLLARLAQTPINLQFLVRYARCIWFLHTFAAVHWIILIMAWIVSSIAL